MIVNKILFLSFLVIFFLSRFTQTPQLNPSSSICIPGTKINYKLLTKNRTFLKNFPNSTPTYIWNPKVGNTSIVDVNSKGVISNNNCARSVVIVQEPDQIVFSSSQVEVEVGKKLVLSTKLLSNHLPNGVHFESCSINNLEWKVKDDSIFKILPHEKVDQQKISSDICSSREFLALKEGSTVISVQYNGMREEIRIFASPPADQIEFLLSLGSSAEVSFCGGKETWLLQPKIYSKFISSDNKEQNSLSITPGDNNSFKVTCQKQSNDPQNVIVTIRNKKSISSPLPEARSIKIPFFCRQPSYVHIQFIKLPTEEEGKQKSREISCLNIHNNSDLPFIAMNSIAKYVKGSTSYPIIVAGSIFIATFAIVTKSQKLKDFQSLSISRISDKAKFKSITSSCKNSKALMDVPFSSYRR
ncbi:hypothetical protein DICPUDRAFT_85395 [Dictyostelium purpureum]|uniref:Ig-like domain-containing protein n=1 Tax=Dictyostelium purpureum TaxID=5786 RepID=F1A5L2_DICPU|nr:uncharacterized protein DICPUDRAFT_85395 [Dictyostelium purpureum]EGC28521.1 hypothetical protein DICPUDRAFT_85395 [Dictyostelium purpureum]|eukprot:XP_003294956.1 hypothetical protein DICPUDRAFT_85395 [Dictyostelium purpureum]